MWFDATVFLGERIKYLGHAVPNVIAYQIPYEQSGNQDSYDRLDKQTVVLTAHGQVSVYGAVDK